MIIFHVKHLLKKLKDEFSQLAKAQLDLAPHIEQAESLKVQVDEAEKQLTGEEEVLEVAFGELEESIADISKRRNDAEARSNKLSGMKLAAENEQKLLDKSMLKLTGEESRRNAICKGLRSSIRHAEDVLVDALEERKRGNNWFIRLFNRR